MLWKCVDTLLNQWHSEGWSGLARDCVMPPKHRHDRVRPAHTYVMSALCTSSLVLAQSMHKHKTNVHVLVYSWAGAQVMLYCTECLEKKMLLPFPVTMYQYTLDMQLSIKFSCCLTASDIYLWNQYANVLNVMSLYNPYYINLTTMLSPYKNSLLLELPLEFSTIQLYKP